MPKKPTVRVRFVKGERQTERERTPAEKCPKCHAPANQPCRTYLGAKKQPCQLFIVEVEYEQGKLF